MQQVVLLLHSSKALAQSWARIAVCVECVCSSYLVFLLVLQFASTSQDLPAERLAMCSPKCESVYMVDPMCAALCSRDRHQLLHDHTHDKVAKMNANEGLLSPERVKIASTDMITIMYSRIWDWKSKITKTNITTDGILIIIIRRRIWIYFVVHARLESLF